MTNDFRATDEHAIRRVLTNYCRAIDRNDWELLRTCYHPGAADEHGRYNGEIDGFVAWLAEEMPRYEATMHLMGNVLIGFADQLTAHVESYCVAYHRLLPGAAGARDDRTVWVRYVDRFECRDGVWAIAHRVCLYDFARIDRVSEGSDLAPAYQRGGREPRDRSYELDALRADRDERTT
jgi:hypothetical protein